MHKVEAFFERYSFLSTYILRIGIGFVFIWFGYSGVTNTDMWIRLVPAWTGFLGSAKTLVIMHGIVELVFGLLVLVGIWTRTSAAILFLSLFHTLFLVSGVTLIRDIGVAAGALALVFHK